MDCDPAVVPGLIEIVENGLASQSGLEVGRRLAACQRCPEFAGATCQRILVLRPARARWIFLAWLTGTYHCERW